MNESNTIQHDTTHHGPPSSTPPHYTTHQPTPLHHTPLHSTTPHYTTPHPIAHHHIPPHHTPHYTTHTHLQRLKRHHRILRFDWVLLLLLLELCTWYDLNSVPPVPRSWCSVACQTHARTARYWCWWRERGREGVCMRESKVLMLVFAQNEDMNGSREQDYE